MEFFRRNWLFVVVIALAIWVVVIGYVVYRNGLVSFPTDLFGSKPPVGSQAKRLYFVEKWDDMSGQLTIKRQNVSTTIPVDVPKIHVIIKAEDGQGEQIVAGVDSRWKTLFCEGDKLMLTYDILEGGSTELRVIRNNGERLCK